MPNARRSRHVRIALGLFLQDLTPFLGKIGG